MRRDRFLVVLVIGLATLFLAGCPAQEVATPVEVTSDPLPAGDGPPQLDTEKLPPPLQELSPAPDLYRARIRVDDNSLQKLDDTGVSSSVVNQLKLLSGRNFLNANQFFVELERVLGKETYLENRDAIIEATLLIDVDTKPAFPGTELQLVLAPAENSVGFSTVLFDFDKSDIKPEFIETIRANARLLNENPTLRIVVEGHCDYRGTPEYNLALGERRAQSVQAMLISYGVDPNQIQTISFGEEFPADPAQTEAAYAKNRRAVLVEVK